jgi:uncharacterized membrane protein (DUF4010 family)
MEQATECSRSLKTANKKSIFHLTQSNDASKQSIPQFSAVAFAYILRAMTNVELTAAFIPIATALGCGLLIGIERERRKQESDVASFAGVRTFALVALLGALTHRVDMPRLQASAGALIVLLIAIAYARSESKDVGITTEIALFVTYVVGIVASINPTFAASIAMVVLVLLLTRTRLHRFATETLTHIEVRDGTILLAIALIVLPLLSDREILAFGAINPHSVGVVVVMLLSIQTIAHVALRAFGETVGGALSGFLSGFVSSTATFAAMAARARDSTGSTNSLAGSTLLSQLASMIQLVALVALLNSALLGRVVLSLGLGAAVIMTASAWLLYQAKRNDVPSEVRGRRMFDPFATVAFVALLTTFTLLVSRVKEMLGTQAANIAAALAALVDLHAAAGAALSLSVNSQATAQETMTALLLMLTVNAASKAVISIGGGTAFFLRVATVLIGALLACWLPQFLAWF